MFVLVHSEVMDESIKSVSKGSISGSLNTNVVYVGGKFIENVFVQVCLAARAPLMIKNST